MPASPFLLRVLLLLCATLLVSCEKSPCGDTAGKIKDEAMCVGVTAEDLSGAKDDFYADMDYGISKDPATLQARLAPYFPGITENEAVERFAHGRNNWVVWTAGNDRLWDELSRKSFGNLDLLKVISNHPNLAAKRSNRWGYLGVVNEPCFEDKQGPRADRFGLWLDSLAEGCSPDPFENENKYPGVKIGARGDNIPVGSYYGYATGIVGLRLFPNPAFNKKAEQNWDPVRYYTDPEYYNSKDLIKPYRVGMSCGFCHVGPNPSHPPKDFNAPEWADLNSNPGAQYFWFDRIFIWNPDETNYVNQFFHTSKPGALDTSLVSTDYINNPRTMNAVYELGARLELGTKWGQEVLKGGELNNKQLNDYLPEGHPLDAFFTPPDIAFTPRVLKDGADSVGALGALNRVYVNIGLFSEEWLEHFNAIVGGKPISPFEIAVAEKNSSYWVANENQTPDVALFFLGSATPDYLAEAPGGESYLTKDQALLDKGRDVFATTCARCHSSKLPSKVFTDFFPTKGKYTDAAKYPPKGCVGSGYLECWDDYWQYSKTDEFKQAMLVEARKPDFLKNNFLSNELRVPVTLLETNACSPLARNALANDIWDNFSSSSYKALPSVGEVQVQNPITGEVYQWKMPAGGRGYTRPASLVSLWSTAPFLLNNNLGPFKYKGTVEARMSSFDTSIEELLWPEKRVGSGGYPYNSAPYDGQYPHEYPYPFVTVTKSGKFHQGYIQTVTEDSYLTLAPGFLPEVVQKFSGELEKLFPKIVQPDGSIRLGPIPAGTPTNLLYNTDLSKLDWNAVQLFIKIIKDLKKLPEDASGEEAKKVFANLVKPLLNGSTCPDFVLNKGHYFGTDYLPETEGETPLTDEEKRALIEYLKLM